MGIQADVGLVVAAAGSSSRFGTGDCKLLYELNGIPVLCHCLRTFARIVAPQATVVMAPPTMLKTFRKTLTASGIHPDVRVLPGGAERQDSVYKGIMALPLFVHIVAIQDAARPYTTPRLLEECIDSARRHGSGVAAKPVTDTIKIAGADGKVASTPDRSTLWAAETPQVFQRTLIADSYREIMAGGKHVTDDAQAVELANHPTFLVRHHEVNSKITYATDLDD